MARAAWHLQDPQLCPNKYLGYTGLPSLARLAVVGFDSIKHHGLDAMHNCFLGIAKTLFQLWFKKRPVRALVMLHDIINNIFFNQRNRRIRVHPQNINQHIRLLNLRFCALRVPHDWGRRPRSILKNGAHWKGRILPVWQLTA